MKWKPQIAHPFQVTGVLDRDSLRTKKVVSFAGNFRIEQARSKTKTILAGRIPRRGLSQDTAGRTREGTSEIVAGQMLGESGFGDGIFVRVTFSRIVDSNGTHLELAGTAPALKYQKDARLEDLADLAAFCEAICSL